ncbi:adenosylcobinamide-GDP ribazoletransferase [Janibacter sp. GS2]|uniref:adenosylcobinamide-GDP ribazoletransferase n=1 Tax=Janibacter sp. GS2 TaxID=3442646 RepID=UPI003EBB2B05
MSSLGRGLRLGVGTFTRLPSGTVDTRPDAARAGLLLAPLAVLPLAGLVAVVCATVELGLPPLVAAGVALAVLAHGSRGMHLDGLADVVDGLGAGWTRQRALEVMRRGDVGPMGTAAIVLVLLVQAAAIAALLAAGWRGAVLVGAAVLVSRASCAAVCVRGQTAAPGSTLGASFVGVVPFAPAALLAVAAAAALVAAGVPVTAVLAPDESTWSSTRSLLLPALAALAGTGAAIALRERAARTLGGVNGDVIGAGVEVALTTTLVLLTLAW